MIFKLKGIVDTVFDSSCIIDVGGVGYGVFAPSSTLRSICEGEAACLYIETVVREDSMTLYGFSREIEKEFFNLLTTVQGVGPKAALAVLAVLSPEQAVSAIAGGNHGAFSAASGIGGKTATRIVSELKSKIGKLGIAAATVEINKRIAGSALAADAVSALVNLGYPRANAEKAVEESVDESPSASLNDIIKSALSRLVS